jgi:hypothetical protein
MKANNLAAPLLALMLALLLEAGAAASTSAQPPGPGLPFDGRWQIAQKSEPEAESQPASSISVEQALYLIRSTLMTLNDANHSGNYTVMRDLASPDFQAKNSAADLAQTFSDLRRRNFDLFAVAIAAPQLTAVPAIDERGMLHLTGMYPTQPLQIHFDLIFQNVAGQWRLFSISVATPKAPAADPNTTPTKKK